MEKLHGNAKKYCYNSNKLVDIQISRYNLTFGDHHKEGIQRRKLWVVLSCVGFY